MGKKPVNFVLFSVLFKGKRDLPQLFFVSETTEYVCYGSGPRDGSSISALVLVTNVSDGGGVVAVAMWHQ